MKKIIHPANERGQADYGWLKARYSFSFANYVDPSRVHFGKLRVFNDDQIDPSAGFGTHPHDNMEIITIPLKGELAHKDSMGHVSVIRENDVQVMSAGTGITHSEFNHSKSTTLNLFQLWIFPEKKGLNPSYDQMSFDPENWDNKLFTLVSHIDGHGPLKINQQAILSRIKLNSNKTLNYSFLGKNNGTYIMLISGKASIAGEMLSERDAVGIWDCSTFSVEAHEQSELLFIEVPMN